MNGHWGSIQTAARLFVLTLVVSLWAQAGETVFIDFGAEPVKIESARSTITGVLPEGIAENSSWADVTIHYSREKDVLGSLVNWIRMDVSEVNTGRAQLKVELPDGLPPSYYKLSLTAASPGGGRLRVVFRKPSDPYTTYIEKTFNLSMGRNTYDWDFKLDQPLDEVSLFVIADNPGVYDLYALDFSGKTEEELAASLAPESAVPANAVPWASFPFGLPDGWSLSGHVAEPFDVEVKASSRVSDRGTTPLSLTGNTGKRWELYSAPIPLVRPVGLYNASFFAKGSGTVVFSVICDGEELMALPIELGEEEKRIDIPFEPKLLGEWTVLAWKSTGSIEIDGLMINPGSYPDPYVPADGAWLSIGSAYDKGHVFVENVDGPPCISYKAGGSIEGAVLQGKVVDFYGKETSFERSGIETNKQGKIFFPLPQPDKHYGSWRIEAWLERNGNRISPVGEVVVHQFRKPHYWGRMAPESKFGNHSNARTPHLYAIKAMGGNWNRFHGGSAQATYWSNVEPKPGEWNWHPEYIDLYRKADLAICAVWTLTPQWARPVRTDVAGGWLDNWWQPADYQQFAEYVAQSTKAYEGKVDAWQIWNEPWGGFWFKEWRPDLEGEARWHKGDTPVDDYIELSKIALKAARDAGITVPVLAVNGTVGDKGKSWMRDTLKKGAADTGDALVFHAYFGGKITEATSLKSRRIWNLKSRIFDPIAATPGAEDKPIWLTEGNWLSRKADTGLYDQIVLGKPDPMETVRENAILLPLYHALMFSLGTDKIFTYALDAGTSHFMRVPRGQINWGALTTHCRMIHPSAGAYSAMAWHLENTEGIKNIQIDDDTAAFVFKKETGEELAVIAGPNLNGLLDRLLQTKGVAVEDFLGNPVVLPSEITHQLIYILFQDASAETVLQDVVVGQ